MERVGVLINKLQEQLLQNADVQNMIITTQLLQRELMFMAATKTERSATKVSVMVPNAVGIQTNVVNKDEKYKPVPKPEPAPEPIQEPITEPENPLPDTEPTPIPKPEPEPIPHFVEQNPLMEVFPEREQKQRWNLDPILEVPTLAHQEKIVYELNDAMVREESSLNEKLKESKTEMAAVLKDAPVRDLKKAISINDRHRFINELFRGDETMYERSIKTINSFHISAEAEYWIQRELKVKLGWNVTDDLVKTFDQLVKRRFA